MVKYRLHWPEVGIEHGERANQPINDALNEDWDGSEEIDWQEEPFLRKYLVTSFLFGELLEILIVGVISISAVLVIGSFGPDVLVVTAESGFWIFVAIAALLYAIDELNPIWGGSYIYSYSMIVATTFIGWFFKLYLLLRERPYQLHPSETIDEIKSGGMSLLIRMGLETVERRRDRNHNYR